MLRLAVFLACLFSAAVAQIDCDKSLAATLDALPSEVWPALEDSQNLAYLTFGQRLLSVRRQSRQSRTLLRIQLTSGEKISWQVSDGNRTARAQRAVLCGYGVRAEKERGLFFCLLKGCREYLHQLQFVVQNN